MRQGKAHLRACVNGNLALRFSGQGLTSFAGLELVRQFLQRIELSRRLRRHLQGRDPAGDFSSVCVQHESPKNFQLDLFDPDDGHWEYSAITTNQPLGLKALWKFMAGRGTHEKVLAQLKNGYAFDVVPTRNFAANSTWQILSVLARNLISNFQIALAAPQRTASAKRRSLFVLRSIHTLRYELLSRAGLVRHPHGRAPWPPIS